MKRIIGIVAVLALVTAACGESDVEALQSAANECAPGEVDGDLNLYNWTEYIPYGEEAIEFEVPDLVAAFESEYGVKIVQTFYDNNEQMVGQVEAGGAAYDVVVPSDYMIDIMIDGELLIELNKGALPNLTNVNPTFINLPYDPTGAYSVPYQWGTTGIGFAYEAVGEDYEESWGMLFDADSPVAGQFSLLDDPREVLGAALKYLGYSLNTTSQAELDKAVALVKSIKANVKLFDTNTFEDNLVAGETLAAHGWNGDFLGAYDNASTDDYDAYEDFGYFIPQEGGVVWVDNMAIPVTAEHPCTAHTFINFMLDAENGAALTNYTYYASPNEAANAFIYEEILEDTSIYPDEATFANLEFITDTGDFEINYSDAFNEIKS